jgi:hypothetical protein
MSLFFQFALLSIAFLPILFTMLFKTKSYGIFFKRY